MSKLTVSTPALSDPNSQREHVPASLPCPMHVPARRRLWSQFQLERLLHEHPLQDLTESDTGHVSVLANDIDANSGHRETTGAQLRLTKSERSPRSAAAAAEWRANLGRHGSSTREDNNVNINRYRHCHCLYKNPGCPATNDCNWTLRSCRRKWSEHLPVISLQHMLQPSVGSRHNR